MLLVFAQKYANVERKLLSMKRPFDSCCVCQICTVKPGTGNSRARWNSYWTLQFSYPWFVFPGVYIRCDGDISSSVLDILAVHWHCWLGI